MADATTPAKVEPTREQVLIEKLLSLKDGTGASVRKLARELFPDAKGIPAEDADLVVAPVKADVDELKTQLKGALDKIAAREKADEDMKAEQEMSLKVHAARKAFGLTDQGYDKMLSRMKETGNYTDADAAAAWVVSQMPKPEPSSSPTWLPQGADFYGSQKKDENWAALHEDPRKFLDDQLRDFVKDPDRYTAETFGTA